VAYAPLPGLLVQWPLVTPVAPDTFVQYNVKRRDAGTNPWTRIATIPTLTVTQYTDYTPASGQDYEYAVTWTSNRGASGGVFESAEAPAVAASVTFPGSFLHDATRQSANAAATYVQLRGNMRVNEPRQSPTITTVWGRAQPTIAFGSYRARHYTYQLITHDPSDPTLWQNLEALQIRQQQHGVPLCLRTEFGDRLFCIISRLTRTDPPWEYIPALEFDELYFSEAT
jgi:hypothetical protein